MAAVVRAMMPRVAGRLAWSVWAVAVTIAVAAMILIVMVEFDFPAEAFGFPGWSAVTGLAFLTVGARVASRQPSNSIGWTFLALGLLSTVQEFVTVYAVLAYQRSTALPFGAAYAAWVADWISIPLTGGFVVFVFLLFPHGRLPGRSGRAVAVLGSVGMLLAVGGAAFGPGPLLTFPTVDNPLALIGSGDVAESLEAGWFVLFLAAMLAVAGMLRRWRRSTGVERQQYKWLVAAGSLVALTFASGIVAVTSGLDPDLERWWPVMQVLLVLGFTAMAVAVGIAILRYRLFEIDRLISRTVTYALVVGVLAVVYSGGVLLLGSLLPLESEVAVAASTLTVAALFNPLRKRMKHWVDRRFHRSRYDAEQELERLAARLRDELDLDELTDDLVAVVIATVQPATANVWIRSVD